MIIIDFSISPKGQRCITMITEDQKKWILFTVKKAPIASDLIRELSTAFKIKSLPGLPLDKEQSLRESKLLFSEYNGVTGIYVQYDKFDHLVDLMGYQDY